MVVSSIAQQKLAELEKTAAPFQEQLIEASKYISLDISSLGSPQISHDSSSKSFHGKEDWVLRWLLKKLQASNGKSARLTPLSWQLLQYLIQTISLRAVARLLNERKFITILCQTLEDAKQQSTIQSSEACSSSDSETLPTKKSRKRKRTETFLTPVSNLSTSELREAIASAISYLVSPPETSLTSPDTAQSSLATAELVKSILRTTADEAARILGSWLSLCRNTSAIEDTSGLIHPFIEIWECRKLGADSMTQFSEHCTNRLLHLMLELPSNPVLEELLVRNVILPCSVSPETRQSLIYRHADQSSLAPLIIEVSLRYLDHRQYSKWFLEVFTALKSAMSTGNAEASSTLSRMIRIAIDYHLKLESSILTSIIVEYAFQEHTDWSLVASVVEADTSIFLSDTGKLLQQLFPRITSAAFQENWSNVSETVIVKVAVPLLNSFAQSGQLTSFMHHWHSQLKEFVRNDNHQIIHQFCTWEDDRLQAALARTMDASLTFNQIIELANWIDERLKIDEKASVVAACVLLQAVAGCPVTSNDDFEKLLDLRLRFSEMLSTTNVTKNLSSPRYSWRKWCALGSIIEYISEWEHHVTIWRAWSNQLRSSFDRENIDSLESYHAIFCTAALWHKLPKWWHMHADNERDEVVLADMLTSFLQTIDKFFTTFTASLQNESDPVHLQPSCIESQTLVCKGSGWFANEYAYSIIKEHYKIIALIPRLEPSTQNLLEKILRIASIPPVVGSSLWAENGECNIIPQIWEATITNVNGPLNNEKVGPQLIQAMVQYTTIEGTSTFGLPDCNIFVAKCLNKAPFDIFEGWSNKGTREAILNSWVANTVLQGYFDTRIWELKKRILDERTLYEGMSFEEVINMAHTFHDIRLKEPQPVHVSELVSAFGGIVERTLLNIFSIANQAKGKAYLKDVAKFLKNEFRQRESFVNKASPHNPIWDHIRIKLIDTVLQTFTSKATDHVRSILDEKQLSKRKAAFKEVLISDLEIVFRLEEEEHLQSPDDHNVFLRCIMDALKTSEITEDDLEPIKSTAVLCFKRLDTVNTDFVKRVRGFLFVHPPVDFELSLTMDATTPLGKFFIEELAMKRLTEICTAAEGGETHIQVAQLGLAYEIAQSIVDLTAAEHRLPKLLELEYILEGCNDLSFKQKDGQHIPAISGVYDILCSMVLAPKCIREFLAASSMMSTILRRTSIKPITQHNIDNTLSVITCICSCEGPSMPADHAGDIFFNLCDLLQAVLSTKHPDKTRNRFHMVLQPMQALLTCLFTTTSEVSFRSESDESKLVINHACWIPRPGSPNSAPFPKLEHASAFARLVTLICEPSKGRKESNKNLNSSRAEAREYAKDIIHLLTLYIKLQSTSTAIKMAPEIHEKLKPAVWAIFNTVEGDQSIRAMIVDELDERGRSVWARLFKDWRMHGKWKGN